MDRENESIKLYSIYIYSYIICRIMQKPKGKRIGDMSTKAQAELHLVAMPRDIPQLQ